MVPKTWVKPNASEIVTEKSTHVCWWPAKDSPDETSGHMTMLVSNCSEPNYDTWKLQVGMKFEDFVDFDKAQSVLRMYASQKTSSEDEHQLPASQPHILSPKNLNKSVSVWGNASSEYTIIRCNLYGTSSDGGEDLLKSLANILFFRRIRQP